MEPNTITFIATSCGRLDLLEKTIDSFLKFNTAPIEQYIISEDDKDVDLTELKVKYQEHNFYWIQNSGPRYGFLGNNDFIYKHANTPWVFHCEDDWEFHRSGFIEKSMTIMESKNEILQVWLRHPDDTNGHPPEEIIHNTNGVEYKLMSLDFEGQWNGFSTNPSLKRLANKVCFEAINKIGPGFIGPEGKVSIYYKLAGFRAAILPEGYVKHIGEGRTTI